MSREAIKETARAYIVACMREKQPVSRDRLELLTGLVYGDLNRLLLEIHSGEQFRLHGNLSDAFAGRTRRARIGGKYAR